MGTVDKLFCVSRPRRFGKSMASRMLAAYYDRSCDSSALFDGLEVSRSEGYKEHLNKHNVIYLDMTSVQMLCPDAREIVPFIMRNINRELAEQFPVGFGDDVHLSDMLSRINLQTGERFIFIIDEWDAVCRELKDDPAAFDNYVRLLRVLFKGDITGRVFDGVYMTGILPIKKYGTQSALNNFGEYTMLMPGGLASYFGFTEREVRILCDAHGVSFPEMKRWYPPTRASEIISP